MTSTTSLIVTTEGTVRCLYDETLELHRFGIPVIHRASFVEPDDEGRWRVDLSPVGGPANLGSYHRRSEALAAECAWLIPRLPHLQPSGGEPRPNDVSLACK